LAFHNSNNQKTTSVATGEALRTTVNFKVAEPIDDAVIEIYFYSIFGKLHCHFSTLVEGQQLRLPSGTGSVEFSCPEIALEAATFNIDVGIKRRDSPPAEFIDCKRAGVLNVTIGKPVEGLFYMPHSWRLSNSNGAVND